jgi:D-amino peptidase
MKVLIITDLEGVAGADYIHNPWTDEWRVPAKRQLGREVNACIEGIRLACPDAWIAVWDGHGSGGLFPEDLSGVDRFYGRQPRYLPYLHLEGYHAVLFVGQHAMAGTPFAPLRHSYSLNIAYMRLNGYFVGEFGLRAFMSGFQGVPTILLAGDDKAAFEAQALIPGIETAVVKRGLQDGVRHRTSDDACRAVREAAKRAIERLPEIAPLGGITAPYELEVRYTKPVDVAAMKARGATVLDTYTVQFVTDNLLSLPE